MPWGRLAPLVAGGLMLGVMFGGTEVAAVAFADEAGRPLAPPASCWRCGRWAA